MNEKAIAPLLNLLNVSLDPQRLAREAQANGATIIALLGAGIPHELIIASGALTTMLVAQPDMPTPIADGLMDPGEQHELRSLLDQIASPAAAFLSLAVLAPPYAGLSATIEEMRRSDLLPHAGPTTYFELPAVGPNNLVHAGERIRALAARLGSATGTPVTQEALQTAIATTNARRSALRRFSERRREAPVISGTEAKRVISAANNLPATAFTQALEALTESLQPDDGLLNRPRILLIPSNPLTHDRAHAAIEEAGALIIAEDDPFGARAAEPAIREDDNPIRAITEHYLQTLSGERVFPADARLNWFYQEAIKPDVDAVIIYGEVPRYGWDYPAMRDYLNAHEKPSVFIRADAQTAEGYAKLKSETKAFLDQMAQQNMGDAA